MPAIDPRLVAVAVAHGLTPGMLATWNPAIARTPRVMVPVQLDALVVREAGGTWADCRMAAPDPGPVSQAHTLLAAPFTERDPRPPGVYLHWALPDALTRGAGSASDPAVRFPALPDRWLVVRLSSQQDAARRPVTAWVIEAGDENPVVTPLDAWTETADPERTSTPGQEPLTALGFGDAGWSAYFDNVQDRLGFYDDLAGAVGPLAYLACGWHSRHIDDPIGAGLSSPTHFEQRLGELGWEINPADIEGAFVYAQQRIEAATSLGLATREARFTVRADAAQGKVLQDAGVAGEAATTFVSPGVAELSTYLGRVVSWPEFTLYHGAVVGIGWPGPGFGVAPGGLLGGSAGGPPAPEDVKVCIGSALTEALAACLADNDGKPDEARILEAVLLGASGELELPDSAVRIDSRLHASGFAGLPGGVRSEPLTQHAPATPTSVVPDPAATDPGVFAGVPAPPGQPGSTAAPPLPGQLVGKAGTPVATRAAPVTGQGGLDSVLSTIAQLKTAAGPASPPRAANADPPAQTVSADRALPRYFVPADPVFLLQGAGRSFKHGSDSMHAESGQLVCRLSGHTVEELGPSLLIAQLRGGTVRGADLLQRGIDHGGVPVECNDLLDELALLDPGSAITAAIAIGPGPAPAGQPGAGPAGAGPAAIAEVATTFAVEQCAWWVARDDRRDLAPVLAASGFGGTLPSPVAVSLPVPPWTPLHLDWEIDLLAAADLADWQLGEVDFDAVPAALPAPDAPATRTLQGRALLSGGAAQVAAATVRTVLEQAQQSAGSQALVPGVLHAFHSAAAQEMILDIGALSSPAAAAEAPATAGEAGLDHIADGLQRMDVLVGAMDRFNSLVRAGFVADRVSQPGPGDPVPADFWPLRAGFLRVKRLRLVDCFGQVLDLLGSGPQQSANAARLLRSEPLTVADRPDLVELAPRFTAPSRLWFRFLSAADDATEADGGASPLCGFVLPNHLDGDLQFAAADGSGLGAVRFDAASGVVWEDSPGQPTNVGTAPSAAVGNRHLAGIAQGLIDWGAADATPDAPATDTALSSLLRIVDAALWTVDPFGHAGDEHLALLIGHPIAVMRALVRVEVEEPVTPGVVRGIRVPVRIGALAHWQDGLLGYFVGDDYRTLRIPDPACADFARPIGPNQGFDQQASATSGYYASFAADLGVITQPGATPVDHPYVDPTGVLWVQPQQDVLLTLLMEPHSVVHATTGYLPRKDIGMRREWVAPGLSALAPVFRFGPVLVDPKLIRMPVASDIHGTWSWSHRSAAATWAEDPVTNSTGDARIPADLSDGQEGWLRLRPEPPAPGQ
jgi:hypothetical protein